MDNDNYITINEQGLAEVNPTASSDMQNAFIDAYRNIQGENTAQIGTQAHDLGSDLEAQYGGLHGPSEYMKSRYQTPQTESRIAGLRTASQLSALNQLMQNDVASWKDKYSQAYRDAQKRARQRAARAAAAAQSPYAGNVEGEVVTEATSPEGKEATASIANFSVPGYSDTSIYQDNDVYRQYTDGQGQQTNYRNGAQVGASDNSNPLNFNPARELNLLTVPFQVIGKMFSGGN